LGQGKNAAAAVGHGGYGARPAKRSLSAVTRDLIIPCMKARIHDAKTLATLAQYWLKKGQV
jgi:hypothetical protein